MSLTKHFIILLSIGYLAADIGTPNQPKISKKLILNSKPESDSESGQPNQPELQPGAELKLELKPEGTNANRKDSLKEYDHIDKEIDITYLEEGISKLYKLQRESRFITGISVALSSVTFLCVCMMSCSLYCCSN